MTFRREDLVALEGCLSSARYVVSMREVYDGKTDDDVIGMRHDVDGNPGALDTALRLSRWEADHGWRSTYFLLHTAPYWRDDLALGSAVEVIAGEGHEIGIHTNALTVALRSLREDADSVLTAALNRLRSYGVEVTGVAAHGDPYCYDSEGRLRYVNDEHFVECARPELGESDRWITAGCQRMKLEPRPLAFFGLDYDTHRLPHGRYLSDSGGRWNEPFPGEGTGQLHVLQHPDWWGRAFQPEGALA